jgi:hypothetical protein
MLNETVRGTQKFRKIVEIWKLTSELKFQSKLIDKGTDCLFVGYHIYCADDVYMILIPKTKHIIKLRDAVWK